MSEQAPPPGELVFTRVFDAPRDLVFQCMTEPEHLTHFWGAFAAYLAALSADAR